MSESFYITTPIYYVNDKPHLGHAYTTVLADVLARYARLQGQETLFVTGTDEHGQKVQNAADARGITPQAQADAMVVRFQGAWEKLKITHDDFIRTTQPRHVRVVETILQRLWDAGAIYKGNYEGWYCVPDERFWTEKDLVDAKCPDCGRPVERIVEPNYFFRMSAHQDWLVTYIETHPGFIQPDIRRNEVLGYLRKPLEDLCISRPASRLSWGIPLPFDPDYVTYVWFDALINYLTAAGYLDQTVPDGQRFARLWSRAQHLVGKDILITHAVYWSTMLHAIGLPLPRTIFAHGMWLSEGVKMSKSLGNVVNPFDLVDIYGVDAVRYFLSREMSPGRDADFNETAFQHRYQADLANDLGNLLNRLVSMINRYCDGRVPEPRQLTTQEAQLRERARALPAAVFARVRAFAVNQALAQQMDVVGEINGYLERAAPWKLAKQGDAERVATTLYVATEALRLVSLLLHPVLPERVQELWRRLGWQPPSNLSAGLAWGDLKPGTQVRTGPPLFPRDVTC